MSAHFSIYGLLQVSIIIKDYDYRYDWQPVKAPESHLAREPALSHPKFLGELPEILLGVLHREIKAVCNYMSRSLSDDETKQAE